MSLGTVTFVPNSARHSRNIISKIGRFGAWRGVQGGPGHCGGSWRAGAGVWQLPERVYSSAAAGAVGRTAGVGVPEMREAGALLRQRSRPELADPAGKMPELLCLDHTPISGGGAIDGRPVSLVLCALRIVSGWAEVRGVRIPAAGADFYRRGNALAA